MKLSQLLKAGCGFAALALGAIGLVLPIWPTTPFVLLAVGCFASMPKIQSKILKIKFIRAYYENRTNGKALTKKTVFSSLMLLWTLLLLSAYMVQSLALSLFLLMIGTGVTIHILYIAKGKKVRMPNDK